MEISLGTTRKLAAGAARVACMPVLTTPPARSAWAPSLVRDLLDLVLPVTCAGCGSPGPVLCTGCLRRWSGPPRRCEHAAGRLDRMDGSTLPVWALAENDGPVRRAVVAWKDGGRADVTSWFGAIVTRAGAWLGPVPDEPSRGSDRPLLVVSAPPSARGLRRRGEDLVAALADAHAAGLRIRGTAADAVPALRLAGRGRDQTGLGVRGRAANLAGRVVVRPRHRSTLAGARVVLVDDVLTTGATLAACRSAVEQAGARVTGAVVLAVTRPPGSGRGWLEPPPDPG